MIVYVVQYHSNAWGHQMSNDDILGIYSMAEKAEKRAKEFEKEYACDDDIVSIIEYELDKDIPSYLAYEYYDYLEDE